MFKILEHLLYKIFIIASISNTVFMSFSAQQNEKFCYRYQTFGKINLLFEDLSIFSSSAEQNHLTLPLNRYFCKK